MIVLDTNVLSEPLRANPDVGVVAWLQTVAEPVVLTSVSVGEILTGVRLLPAGRRRNALTTAIEGTLANFADRVLPYDETAARRYAELQHTRRAVGHPLSVEDGMIAAICLESGARLATRNIKDFDGLDLDLVNPWESTG